MNPQEGKVPRLPSVLSHECLVCGTALSGPAGLVLRAVGVSRSGRNPNVCNRCDTHLEEGSVKEITVLFADLSGFTGLTGSLGPEGIHQVVDTFLRMATESIVRRGGFIDKYIGDAVMAFFNVPLRRENHPAMALEAALEIQSQMAALSKQFGLTLKATAGISKGYARVGRLGSGDAKDYTAIGDVVNLAARLQAAARPGEVMADASVYQAAAAGTEKLEGELITLKGFAEPVEAFRFLSMGPPPAPAPRERRDRGSFLGIGALAFAAIGAPCAAAAAFGPLALLLGIGTAASGIAGAATSGNHGLDSPMIRIPLLGLAVIGALVNLAAVFHARKLAFRAVARGAYIPPTRREARITWWVACLSLAALALVIAEALSHHFLMHHPWP